MPRWAGPTYGTRGIARGVTPQQPGGLTSADSLAIIDHRFFGYPLPEHLKEYYAKKYGDKDETKRDGGRAEGETRPAPQERDDGAET